MRPRVEKSQWACTLTASSSVVGVRAGGVRAGTIPSQIGNCVNLQTLHLQSNDFTGELCAFGCACAHVAQTPTVIVKCCRFSGHIPSEMGGLTNLVDLNLSMNQLTGEPRNERTVVLLQRPAICHIGFLKLVYVALRSWQAQFRPNSASVRRWCGSAFGTTN